MCGRATLEEIAQILTAATKRVGLVFGGANPGRWLLEGDRMDGDADRSTSRRLAHRSAVALQTATAAEPRIPQDHGAPLPPPPADGQNRQFSQQVNQLVDQIANLRFSDAVDLVEALKIRFRIPDTPVMAPGMMMAAAAAPAAAAGGQEAAAAEDATPKKTTFAVKLVKFDDTKKIALIKEIKAIVPNLNLVQAKKFVEGAPKLIKEDLGKDEAAELKKKLEAVGAVDPTVEMIAVVYGGQDLVSVLLDRNAVAGCDNTAEGVLCGSQSSFQLNRICNAHCNF
uniref:Ribosomal protein L7/L12 C-terminal domain-containing protein n=1 Tax=Plectus sambesii TaxID=2011161 RepID=A0A914UZ34_9BILA